jgi:ethanolamine utilization protein EutQ (cupin superfamily)
MAADQTVLADPVIVVVSEQPLLAASEVPAGVSLKRFVTRRDHGSLLNAGMYVMAEGEASRWWSTEETPWEEDDVMNVGPVHEFLYVLEGTCTVETPDRAYDCGEGTAVFIPPEGRFRMINRASTVAKVIYGLTPTLF